MSNTQSCTDAHKHVQRHVYTCCWPVACMSMLHVPGHTYMHAWIDSPVVRDMFGLGVSLLLHFCSFKVCLKSCCNRLFQVYSMWLCIAIMEDRNHFPFKGLNKAEPSSKTLIFKLFQGSVWIIDAQQPYIYIYIYI